MARADAGPVWTPSLRFLDDEPELGYLCVVEALGGGGARGAPPRVAGGGGGEIAASRGSRGV